MNVVRTPNACQPHERPRPYRSGIPASYAYVADYRKLLRAHVPQTQQILRRLVVGKLTFTPKLNGNYEFVGRGTVRPLLAEVVRYGPRRARSPCLVKRRWRRHHSSAATFLSRPTDPNALWCADYKGEFRLGNRQYCYPLTITDHPHSMRAALQPKLALSPGHSSNAASIWRLAERKTSRRAKRLLLAGTRCHGAFSLSVSASISPKATS